MRLTAFWLSLFLVSSALTISSPAQTGCTDDSQRVCGVELYHQHQYGEAAALLKQAVKKNKGAAE